MLKIGEILKLEDKGLVTWNRHYTDKEYRRLNTFFGSASVVEMIVFRSLPYPMSSGRVSGNELYSW